MGCYQEVRIYVIRERERGYHEGMVMSCISYKREGEGEGACYQEGRLYFQ